MVRKNPKPDASVKPYFTGIEIFSGASKDRLMRTGQA
jgi:hypothetical protein